MTIPHNPPFSVDEYENRLARTQQALSDRGLDGILVFSPHNVLYLTGFDTENLFDYQCLVVPADGEPALVIFDFELGRWEASAWLRRVRAYTSFEDPVAITMETLREMGNQWRTVGIEHGALTVDIHALLTDGLAGVQLRDSFGVVEQSRLVKSEGELAYMRQAAEQTDRGVAAGFAAMAEGVLDHEVAAAIVEAMYRAGSETLCWGPVVAAGWRSGTAHSTFGGERLCKGDTVFLELTGQVHRYTAPAMRTAVLGPPTADVARLGAVVAEAVATILRTARPGVAASDVAAAALRVLDPVLPDLVFHHFFGYPVGIGYPPSWIERLGFFLRTDNTRPLTAGMAFHLPMSLRRYGDYAVNLSHTIVVGDDGAEALTKTPAELHTIPL